jgi:hypothetical protein
MRLILTILEISIITVFIGIIIKIVLKTIILDLSLKFSVGVVVILDINLMNAELKVVKNMQIIEM